MKINKTVCDMCGKDDKQTAIGEAFVDSKYSMYEPSGDSFLQKLDLCEDCYQSLIKDLSTLITTKIVSERK